MKQRKVFIGITLPQTLKKRLVERLTKWQSLPIRFSQENNFHVTLAFIGYIGDESVVEVCQNVETVCQNMAAFDIMLERIRLEPESGSEAKMLWLTGKPNEALKNLAEALEQGLGIFVTRKKIFAPHITLGKIRKTLWQQLPIQPIINETLNVSLPVESVTVFESAFRSGEGLKYEPLGVCELAG